MQRAHASAGSSIYLFSSINLRFDIMRDMRIMTFVFLVGVLAHPIARKSVLPAPVRSHGKPPWGAHAAAGATSATSAHLADLGSSPMSAGWAGRFMLNDPPGPLTSPQTWAAAWEISPVVITVGIAVVISELRWK